MIPVIFGRSQMGKELLGTYTVEEPTSSGDLQPVLFGPNQFGSDPFGEFSNELVAPPQYLPPMPVLKAFTGKIPYSPKYNKRRAGPQVSKMEIICVNDGDGITSCAYVPNITVNTLKSQGTSGQ